MRPESLRGYGPVGTNGPESFDAVLAEMRDAQRAYAGDHASGTIRRLADRLQSAHARELAEARRLLAESRELATSHFGLLTIYGMTDGVEQTRAHIAAIDAFLAQQALAGGERKDG